MARDVFVSYRSEDREAAQRICARLEHENISCWMAPRDIPIGKEWAAAIVEGIQRCKAFLVILSSNSKVAKQISREAELADNQGIPIFTFRIEDVQPPPGLLYFLGNIQWLDAFGGQFDSALTRLVEVIKQGAGYPAERTSVRSAAATQSVASSANFNLPPPGFAAEASVPPLIPSEPSSTRTFAAPPEPSLPEPAGSSEKASDSPALWMGIGAAVVVVLCLIGWFWFHRSQQAQSPVSSATPVADGKAFPSRNPVRVPKPDSMDEAKAVADRFLKERNSGNLDAAWGEYSQSFRDRLNEAQWKQNVQAARLRRGSVKTQFNGCNPDREERYICDYTLVSANGFSETDRLTMAKQSDNTWAISGASAKRLP